MTTAELVNLIIAKLHPQASVTFTDIGLTAAGHYVQFEYGYRYYHILHSIHLHRIAVRELTDGDCKSTQFSQWVEGVLNGKVRDESGELVTTNEQAD